MFQYIHPEHITSLRIERMGIPEHGRKDAHPVLYHLVLPYAPFLGNRPLVLGYPILGYLPCHMAEEQELALRSIIRKVQHYLIQLGQRGFSGTRRVQNKITNIHRKEAFYRKAPSGMRKYPSHSPALRYSRSS